MILILIKKIKIKGLKLTAWQMQEGFPYIVHEALLKIISC